MFPMSCPAVMSCFYRGLANFPYTHPHVSDFPRNVKITTWQHEKQFRNEVLREGPNSLHPRTRAVLFMSGRLDNPRPVYTWGSWSQQVSPGATIAGELVLPHSGVS